MWLTPEAPEALELPELLEAPDGVDSGEFEVPEDAGMADFEAAVSGLK